MSGRIGYTPGLFSPATNRIYCRRDCAAKQKTAKLKTVMFMAAKKKAEPFADPASGDADVAQLTV